MFAFLPTPLIFCIVDYLLTFSSKIIILANRKIYWKIFKITAHSSTLSLFNGRVCIGGKRGVVSVVRVPWGRLMHTYSLSLSCSGRRNEMEEAGDRTRRVGSNKRQIYSSE